MRAEKRSVTLKWMADGWNSRRSLVSDAPTRYNQKIENRKNDDGKKQKAGEK